MTTVERCLSEEMVDGSMFPSLDKEYNLQATSFLKSRARSTPLSVSLTESLWSIQYGCRCSWIACAMPKVAASRGWPMFLTSDVPFVTKGVQVLGQDIDFKQLVQAVLFLFAYRLIRDEYSSATVGWDVNSGIEVAAALTSVAFQKFQYNSVRICGIQPLDYDGGMFPSDGGLPMRKYKYFYLDDKKQMMREATEVCRKAVAFAFKQATVYLMHEIGNYLLEDKDNYSVTNDDVGKRLLINSALESFADEVSGQGNSGGILTSSFLGAEQNSTSGGYTLSSTTTTTTTESVSTSSGASVRRRGRQATSFESESKRQKRMS
jgi:hypothetical protein